MCESKTFKKISEERKAGKLMNKAVIMYCLSVAVLLFSFGVYGVVVNWPKPAVAEEEKVSLPEVYMDDEMSMPTDEEMCLVFKNSDSCSIEILNSADVQGEIINRAQEYHIDVELALQMAECESTFDIYAKNPKSTAKGVYQFTDPTWGWIKAEGHQFDYKENIKQFMIWWQVYPEWWQECIDKIKSQDYGY